MDIREEKKGHVTILSLSGRLDSSNSTELDAYLNDMFDRGEKIILMNCGGILYISSSGLRSFLMGLKKTKAVQGQFYLCNLTPQVQEVFEISGFPMLFKIFSSEREALDRM